MTVKELAEKLGAEIITGKNSLDREVDGCYIGDLLSWVMGRAEMDNVWLTVMGNINTIAVATLADVSCIVLTENVALDANAKARAVMQDVAILKTEENSYQTAIKIYKLFEEEA